MKKNVIVILSIMAICLIYICNIEKDPTQIIEKSIYNLKKFQSAQIEVNANISSLLKMGDKEHNISISLNNKADVNLSSDNEYMHIYGNVQYDFLGLEDLSIIDNYIYKNNYIYQNYYYDDVLDDWKTIEIENEPNIIQTFSNFMNGKEYNLVGSEKINNRNCYIIKYDISLEEFYTFINNEEMSESISSILSNIDERINVTLYISKINSVPIKISINSTNTIDETKEIIIDMNIEFISLNTTLYEIPNFQ